MADISEDIKQPVFKSEYSKAIINLLYTSNYLKDMHNKLFKSFNLTTPQFNILRILRGQHPKPATVNLLIDRMLDKSSNASRIVDRLESKGLVERKQCNGDRRAVDVAITNKGLDFLSKVDEALDDLQTSMETLTVEESQTLNALLDKLRI